MGFAWRRDGTQAVWAEVPTPSIMGCNRILAVHGCLVTSIIESAGAMGFAGWVVLGVVGKSRRITRQQAGLRSEIVWRPRREILDARTRLLSLARRLRDTRPVRACGVAMVSQPGL